MMAEANEDCPASNSTDTSASLSMSQQARIERNRQRAMLLRQEKASKRIFSEIDASRKDSRLQVAPKVIDTGGGFLLEEDEAVAASQMKVVHQPGALLDSSEKLFCEECGKPFMDSYLFDKFSKAICENCKDLDERHRLITKTEAKERYLLTDVDLDVREPILKFLLKKNPHHTKFGDMKLYLEAQVAERSLEVWGSDEKLEEEKERRLDNREKVKKKKFDKKVKDLRMAVRGSMYKKPAAGHQHEYGEETYNESDDTYTKNCLTCDHSVTFEKM